MQSYQNEYNNKYNELTQRLQDIKVKQNETDTYIISEAEKLIKDKKKQLQKKYNVKAQDLEEQYNKKEEVLNRKIIIRNRIIICGLVYAILITILLIIWR